MQHALLACRSMRGAPISCWQSSLEAERQGSLLNHQLWLRHCQQQAQHAEHGQPLTAGLGRHRRLQVLSACSLTTCGRFSPMHAPTMYHFSQSNPCHISQLDLLLPNTAFCNHRMQGICHPCEYAVAGRAQPSLGACVGGMRLSCCVHIIQV